MGNEELDSDAKVRDFLDQLFRTLAKLGCAGQARTGRTRKDREDPQGLVERTAQRSLAKVSPRKAPWSGLSLLTVIAAHRKPPWCPQIQTPGPISNLLMKNISRQSGLTTELRTTSLNKPGHPT